MLAFGSVCGRESEDIGEMVIGSLGRREAV
jgi:hypothetical protein